MWWINLAPRRLIYMRAQVARHHRCAERPRCRGCGHRPGGRAPARRSGPALVRWRDRRRIAPPPRHSPDALASVARAGRAAPGVVIGVSRRVLAKISPDARLRRLERPCSSFIVSDRSESDATVLRVDYALSRAEAR